MLVLKQHGDLRTSKIQLNRIKVSKLSEFIIFLLTNNVIIYSNFFS